MRVLPLFAFACLLAANVRAGALDSPGEKKITVKSEAQRGYSAVLAVESADAGTLAFEDAVRGIEDKNEQERTDSEGFQLGVEFAAWQFYWQLLSSGRASVPVGGGKRLDATAAASGMADFRYKGFRALGTRLGVTGDDLKELFAGYDPGRDNAAWEAAVKDGAFKGTKRSDRR